VELDLAAVAVAGVADEEEIASASIQQRAILGYFSTANFFLGSPGGVASAVSPSKDGASTRVTIGQPNVSLRCSVYGIPSAHVSWWHGNRLVANGSSLEHAWDAQHYAVMEHRASERRVREQTRVCVCGEGKVCLTLPGLRLRRVFIKQIMIPLPNTHHLSAAPLEKGAPRQSPNTLPQRPPPPVEAGALRARAFPRFLPSTLLLSPSLPLSSSSPLRRQPRSSLEGLILRSAGIAGANQSVASTAGARFPPSSPYYSRIGARNICWRRQVNEMMYLTAPSSASPPSRKRAIIGKE